jgi:hypothetical protein
MMLALNPWSLWLLTLPLAYIVTPMLGMFLAENDRIPERLLQGITFTLYLCPIWTLPIFYLLS